MLLYLKVFEVRELLGGKFLRRRPQTAVESLDRQYAKTAGSKTQQHSRETACCENIEVLVDCFQKIAEVSGRSPEASSADGETLLPRKRIFESLKTFCKWKSFQKPRTTPNRRPMCLIHAIKLHDVRHIMLRHALPDKKPTDC